MRTKHLWLIGFACVGFVVAPASADETQNVAGSFEYLLGDWSGDCDAWGTPAKCEISWQGGLHPEHFIITYEIQNAKSGDTIFAGQGTYRSQADHADGFWADSSGDVHPLNAKWKETTLQTHWGVAGDKQGRTYYALNADGSLTVTDSVLQSSGWREFMRVEYSKK